MRPVFMALLAGLAGFAFVQPASAAKFQEQIVYSFCQQQKCADGWAPSGSLLDVQGVLYGTTYLGGGTACGGSGCGTVFSLDPATGTETVLYSFAGGADGQYPAAGLMDVNGTLYGTTQQGGNFSSACYPGGCGTVFALDPATGKKTLVYSFCSQQDCADGANPLAGLIAGKGLLYGTTQNGGGADFGTVFSIDTNSGAETLLHSFGGGTDGAHPSAGLVDVGGTLYGTTFAGGAYDGGTVFSVVANSGAESVLHSFDCCTGADGAYPLGDLIDVKGTLYGTTYDGGQLTGCTGGQGCGTVFSITRSGMEKIVHAFGGGKDGQGPESGLISVKGALYGTTGGSGTDGANAGTVFAFHPKTGKESRIYAFQGDPDGALPTADLISVGGTLYGTTQDGGDGECGTGEGCGAIFALTPAKGAMR